jgi:hypothetical protein
LFQPHDILEQWRGVQQLVPIQDWFLLAACSALSNKNLVEFNGQSHGFYILFSTAFQTLIVKKRGDKCEIVLVGIAL